MNQSVKSKITKNVTLLVMQAIALGTFLNGSRAIYQTRCPTLMPSGRRGIALTICGLGVIQSVVIILVQLATLAYLLRAPELIQPISPSAATLDKWWMVFNYVHALFMVVLGFGMHLYAHWATHDNPKYDRRTKRRIQHTEYAKTKITL